MDKVAQYFDELAPKWDTICTHDAKLESLLSSLDIKEGDKVLDVACGTGIISERLYNMSKTTVDAIDVSAEMIKIAKTKDYIGVNFKAADFYTYRDSKYDVIVIFNAYPHFLDLNKFKASLCELLNNHGRVYILHDCDRVELNSHHKAHAMMVSRMLDDIPIEARKYQDKFEIIEAYENNSTIKIALKLK